MSRQFPIRPGRHPRSLARLLVACLLAAAPAASWASPQEPDLASLPLEDLLRVQVSTASKFLQDASEAPSAVRVIDTAQIRTYGWRTLAEALASLTSHHFTEDGEYHFMGTRGLHVPGDYNTRLLLLLDGHRINDNVYEQASTGHEFALDLAMVERIEVIPGPGSALYGSNAFLGVVNVITRARGSKGTRAGVEWTTDGWRALSATTSSTLAEGAIGWTASVSRATKDSRDFHLHAAAGPGLGEGFPTAGSGGLVSGLDRSSRTRAFLSVQGEHARLTAWASEREVRSPTALFGTLPGDPRRSARDEGHGIGLSGTRALDAQWQLDGRLSYQWMKFDGAYPYEPAAAGMPLATDEARGRWWAGEARVLYRGMPGHQWMLGADFHRDVQAAMRTYPEGPTGPASQDVDGSTRRHGVFVQDEWSLHPGWRVNAGLRHDDHGSGIAETSPRLGLIWNPGPHTTMKWMAGRAFRAANLYERVFEDEVTRANPTLRPERIRALEWAVEHRDGPAQQWSASLYRYRILDLITLVERSESLWQYVNTPAVTSTGVELGWRLRDPRDLNLSADLALGRARHDDGQRLAHNPRWNLKLRGDRPLGADGWRLALEAEAVGPMDVLALEGRQRLGTQAWANLAISQRSADGGWRWTARVVNLFDRTLYQPVASAPVPVIPRARRSLSLGIDHAF